MADYEIFLKKVNPARLTERLDAVYQLEQENNAGTHRYAKSFHAGSVAECLRQNAYSILKYEPGPKKGKRSWQLAAEIGDHVHNELQKDMISAGMLFDYPGFGPAKELSLDKAVHPDRKEELTQLNVGGRIDAVLELNGVLVIGDIKTTSSDELRDVSEMGFRDRAKFEDKLRKWQAQLMLYLHFFGTPDGRRATHGFIYQVARDDVEKRVLWDLSYDSEFMETEILSRLRVASSAVKNGELPPAERERGNCHFCRYKSICPAWIKPSEVIDNESN